MLYQFGVEFFTGFLFICMFVCLFVCFYAFNVVNVMFTEVALVNRVSYK